MRRTTLDNFGRRNDEIYPEVVFSLGDLIIYYLELMHRCDY